LKDSTLIKAQGLIAGSWVDADEKKTIKVTSQCPSSPKPLTERNEDPATGEELGTVPEMGLAETRKAISAASEAFKSWSRTTTKV
jgi:succinate-semialdehyde dehydrogenase/glutarate-semialdehyde dehydrogenase